MQAYSEEYHVPWTLPSNFEAEQTSSFIMEAKNTFENCRDDISSKLTLDLISLIKGKQE